MENKESFLTSRSSFVRGAIIGAVCVLAGFASSPIIAQDRADKPVGDDYVIGPGDSLNVFVWRQPELSTVVPVRPDGMISTPLVEDLIAVGKTPTQLAREIESVLAEYIRTPQVTVIVESFVGTFGSQVRVVGAVQQPGSLPFRDQMTLFDVILQVGGLTEFASGNRSKLIRTVDGEVVETRVRLEDLLEGDISLNTPVQPGDVIVVPEAIF